MHVAIPIRTAGWTKPQCGTNVDMDAARYAWIHNLHAYSGSDQLAACPLFGRKVVQVL